LIHNYDVDLLFSSWTVVEDTIDSRLSKLEVALKNDPLYWKIKQSLCADVVVRQTPLKPQP
jgi:hypothetical protein